MSAGSSALRPTKKQQELLRFIEAFIIEHGYSPSYREIMNGLEYNSVATVALHVGNLIKRGHLRKRDHSARSIEVVTTAIETPKQQDETAPADNRWLPDEVERRFRQAEDPEVTDPPTAEDLTVLVAALRILGFEDDAQLLVPRLKMLGDGTPPSDARDT